jgi:hypothetical protein
MKRIQIAYLVLENSDGSLSDFQRLLNGQMGCINVNLIMRHRKADHEEGVL